MRIGHGYDVHQLLDKPSSNNNKQELILGGVVIDSPYYLLAHSDGDAILHALCDALLGAAGLGDIGQHFPDTDDSLANIDSRKLLRHVMVFLTEEQWQVSNVDITVVAQVPKLAPHIAEMKVNIADDLSVDGSQVNVKATTTEGLGFIGEKKGIAAYAVVLLAPITPSPARSGGRGLG